MATTNCLPTSQRAFRARLFLIQGASSAYEPGDTLDPSDTNIKATSPITLREISGTLAAASLPTFLAHEISGWGTSGTSATIVLAVTADQDNAPDFVTPVGFRGLTVEMFR